MRRCTSIWIAALLALMPAAGQIIQRMERDIAPAAKQQELERGPLLDTDALKKIALFSRFGRELRSEEGGILRRAALRLSQGNYAAAQQDWELALGKMIERQFQPNLDALVQGVLHQAYLERNATFQPLAAAVKFREEQREAAYTQRRRLERIKGSFDEGKVPRDLQIQPLILTATFAAGVPAVDRAEPQTATAESVSTELQRTIGLCDAADRNVQQAVLDLQEALANETLQKMSNAAKMLHDTAAAFINSKKG